MSSTGDGCRHIYAVAAQMSPVSGYPLATQTVLRACHCRSWYRALPQTVDARDEQHITAEELVRIVSRRCTTLSVRSCAQAWKQVALVP